MKLYQRYFFYGTIVTSLFWLVLFYLYYTVLEAGSKNGHTHPRLRPKHGQVESHFQNRDLDQDVFDGDGEIGAKSKSKSEMNEKEALDAVEKSRNELFPGQDLGELAMIRTAEDQRIRDEGYRLYAFNQLVSDRIGFHRTIPDTRNKLCKNEVFTTDLPQASIIICFYNEARSALLRTVHSVLDRTPDHLLKEIILVDDASNLSHLQTDLDTYLDDHVPIARLVRTHERQGLIRARIMGAEHATAEVIVFLDSHCEVNEKWLEPLLARIHKKRQTVAIPIIDIVNMDTMKYEASPLVRGGFNWGMFFRWDPVPAELLQSEEDAIRPLKSPTMAGGLFAMDRNYFMEMGKYDPGLDIWGGENLEISFRIWLCGGRLEIIPCSRVGHIFRKRRPYGNPQGGDTMTHNSLRVAQVWLDEYKEYYFQTRPEARNTSYGDISDRLKLRQSLHCKSFKWYLMNVYPEQTLPQESGHGNVAKGQPMRAIMPEKPTVTRKGFLYQKDSGKCVVAMDDPRTKKSMLKLENCPDKNSRNEVWYETNSHALQLAGLLCLDFEELPRGGHAYPRLMKCHFSGGSQEWVWKKFLIMNPASGKCLSSSVEGFTTYLVLDICDTNNPSQRFKLTLSAVR